jgi:hypothetical protein
MDFTKMIELNIKSQENLVFRYSLQKDYSQSLLVETVISGVSDKNQENIPEEYELTLAEIHTNILKVIRKTLKQWHIPPVPESKLQEIVKSKSIFSYIDMY